MQRPLIAMFCALATCCGLIWLAYIYAGETKSDLVKIVAGVLVFPNLVLFYYQMRRSLLFERRKVTHDFIFGPVITLLLPLERRLVDITKQTLFTFGPAESTPSAISLSIEDRRVVIDILNIYERIAISTRFPVVSATGSL